MAVQPAATSEHQETRARRAARGVKRDALPPLASGDRLTRHEFEQRYEAMPHVKKAELIEGVVYMPSPVSASHGHAHGDIVAWLSIYCAATPGTYRADN
jgi:hypothetical protein